MPWIILVSNHTQSWVACHHSLGLNVYKIASKRYSILNYVEYYQPRTYFWLFLANWGKKKYI